MAHINPDFEITRRSTYILPTKIGWYFALVLLALFVFAIKYSNQPAYVMLFVLAGLGVVCMHYTNNNIQGLAMSSKAPLPVFKGESASFPTFVYNDSKSARHAIWMISEGFQHMFSLKQGEHKLIEIKHHTLARGYLSCPEITLSSQFPLGLLFSWGKKYKPKTKCLVYPQPLFRLPLPINNTAGNQDNTNKPMTGPGDEFAGLKTYSQGDRIRDIHWPSIAKQQKLISKQFEQMGGNQLDLNWNLLPNHLSNEDKLSVLCAWIIEATEKHMSYSLTTPKSKTPLNTGTTHKHNCLKALALY